MPGYLLDDNAELEFLRRQKSSIPEIEKVSFNKWLSNTAVKDFETERDALLCLSRYSKQLNLQNRCASCNNDIFEEHIRGLECRDLDMCGECHDNNKEPNGHAVFHVMVNLR